MTRQQAKTLKYGDVVRYGVVQRAIVQRVTCNGVWVSFDGLGPKRGQYVTERTAACNLERVQ